MPSWNEKPHVIPTINVNLKTCTCSTGIVTAGSIHAASCPGSPVLIPCPIPRSVTFTVAPGECDYPRDACGFGHLDNCPARPIRVACSISGQTWAESEVFDVENAGRPDGLFIGVGPEPEDALAACRERWALVKALVLGQNPATNEREGLLVAAHYNAMLGTRNAVFAALAKRVRAEDAGDEAMAEFFAEVPGSVQVSVGRRITERLSESALAAYVEHLIEQAGVLP